MCADSSVQFSYVVSSLSIIFTTSLRRKFDFEKPNKYIYKPS